MNPFVRLELIVVFAGLGLGVLGYLLHSSTLEFFALLVTTFAAALVVARVLLSP